mgnify:CR=1 FL=1
MSDQLTLSAEVRERAGKGASRAMRREGRVPAVIYGDKKDPEPIHLDERELMKLLHTGHFMNSLVSLTIGKDKTNALPKDVQFHPVNDRPMHVDFLRKALGAPSGLYLFAIVSHDVSVPPCPTVFFRLRV